MNTLVCPVHSNSPLSLVPLPIKGLTHQFGLVCQFDPNELHYTTHNLQPLIACAHNSKKIKPYFRSKNNQNDGGGGGDMTEEHLHAQYLIQQWIRQGVKFSVTRYICHRKHFQTFTFEFVEGTRCELEYRPHEGVIGDVVAIDNSGQVVLCVEVKATHATENPRNCEWIEVDANDVIWSTVHENTIHLTDIRTENPHPACVWRPSQPCQMCAQIEADRALREEQQKSDWEKYLQERAERLKREQQLREEEIERRRKEKEEDAERRRKEKEEEAERRRKEKEEEERKEAERRRRIIESLPAIHCNKCKRLCQLTHESGCGHLKLCDDCQSVCDREGVSGCLVCFRNEHTIEQCAQCGEVGLVIAMSKCHHHLCLSCCHRSHQAKDRVRPYERDFQSQMKANQIWNAGNYCVTCSK